MSRPSCVQRWALQRSNEHLVWPLIFTFIYMYVRISDILQRIIWYFDSMMVYDDMPIRRYGATMSCIEFMTVLCVFWLSFSKALEPPGAHFRLLETKLKSMRKVERSVQSLGTFHYVLKTRWRKTWTNIIPTADNNSKCWLADLQRPHIMTPKLFQNVIIFNEFSDIFQFWDFIFILH